MCPDDIFLDLAEWAPFWEKVLIWLTICSLCYVYLLFLVFSHLCFQDGNFVLIVPVPGHFIDLLCDTQS